MSVIEYGSYADFVDNYSCQRWGIFYTMPDIDKEGIQYNKTHFQLSMLEIKPVNQYVLDSVYYREVINPLSVKIKVMTYPNNTFRVFIYGIFQLSFQETVSELYKNNPCISCAYELGEQNPRQYCRKTYCPFEKDN